VLFAEGDVDALALPQLAMVGARNPTAIGRDTATQFAEHLARSGLTITSGLALGIDAASHRGALRGGGRTIAVLGNGLDRIYPAENAALAREIAARGLLLSEFPIGVAPRKDHFPRRNRIISGLCVGTLVVEAAVHSGLADHREARRGTGPRSVRDSGLDPQPALARLSPADPQRGQARRNR
jgi:DNA processing protein